MVSLELYFKVNTSHSHVIQTALLVFFQRTPPPQEHFTELVTSHTIQCFQYMHRAVQPSPQSTSEHLLSPLKETPRLLAVTLYSSLLLTPLFGNHEPSFCLQIRLFWIFPTNGTLQNTAFCGGFFRVAVFLGFFVRVQVLVLHSLLANNSHCLNRPCFVYSFVS